MIALLAITAILLLVSGTMKLRAAGRAKLGLHLFSLLEIMFGGLVLFLMISSPLTASQGFGVTVAGTTLIIISSLHLGSRLRHQRRIRDLSEGRRLENYVKYFSNLPGEEGGQEETPPAG